MTRALAVLLTHAIDYAGVFPPAKLDLATALQEYIRYRSGPEAWVLGKFAVRATQLEEFSTLLKAHEITDSIPVTVIGRGGTDRPSWELGLSADAEALNSFQQSTEGLACVEAYEIKLPTNTEAPTWIADLRGFGEAEVFAELAWDDHQQDALAAIAENEFVKPKARLGGESAAAFPNSTQVAGFIQGAIQLEVPFKLTAGLHHAHPFFSRELGVRMHGYLNVYAATAFAIANDLSVREIAAVLDADDLTAFTLSNQGLSGLGWSVDLGTLGEAREYFVGFGSCSIQEPLDTLRAVGLDIN